MKKLASTIAIVLLFATTALAAVFTVENTAQWGRYSRGISIGAQTIVFRNVAVDTVAADADVIDFQYHRQIMIRVVTGGTITTLTPYVEADPNTANVFEIINDEDGNQITITVSATGWYVIDADMFPAGAIRFQSNNEDGTIDVCLKS